MLNCGRIAIIVLWMLESGILGQGSRRARSLVSYKVSFGLCRLRLLTTSCLACDTQAHSRGSSVLRQSTNWRVHSSSSACGPTRKPLNTLVELLLHPTAPSSHSDRKVTQKLISPSSLSPLIPVLHPTRPTQCPALPILARSRDPWC